MAGDRERAGRVDVALEKLRAQGVHGVWVDRAPVYDKSTLLHALYQALQLPAWFGFNWDALEECLVDFGSNGNAPTVLVFNDFDLLEERDPDTASMFVDILQMATSQPGSMLRGMVRVSNITTTD